MHEIVLRIPDSLHKRMIQRLTLLVAMDMFCPEIELEHLLLGVVVVGIETDQNIATLNDPEES